MAEFEGIARQFVEFYYANFDQDRSGLQGLYRDGSMLTFESTSIQGVQPIIEKLVGLPFSKVKHAVSTLDAQPTPNNGIVVMVTGQLLVDDEQRPMNYTQIFHLLPTEGSYYVHNDIFRLVYF